ncbi:hypothetical protein CPBF426_17510 [Xanthomonas arboricola pv. juglandis]|nr:hypothetical protein CPBF426_17510 [Xanthomonas arboricola pv. juglandis]
MIDSRPLSQLAEAAWALLAGQITNDEFERRVPHSSDPAVREIYAKGFWPQYSDLKEHRLIGQDKLLDEEREFAVRCILFLKSDLPCCWPTHSQPEAFGRFLANLLTLGASGRGARKRLKAMGDTSAWPFRTHSEYLAVMGWPPYLFGLGPNNSFKPKLLRGSA